MRCRYQSQQAKTSTHYQLLATHSNYIATYQLPTTPVLRFAVDQQRAFSQQQLHIRAQLHRVGELEELAEPDLAVPNGDRAHATIMAYPAGRAVRPGDGGRRRRRWQDR